jgi:hypothetical protein
MMIKEINRSADVINSMGPDHGLDTWHPIFGERAWWA